MKHFIILLSFLFLSSCKEVGNSLIDSNNKYSSERTNATLIVTSPVNLSGVTYDVIEIHSGGSVNFVGGVNNVGQIKNLIPFNGKAVINVSSSCSLITNILLFNNTDFNNYGTTIITGYIKSTNPDGFLNNVGNFYYTNTSTTLEWNAGTLRNSGMMSMIGTSYYPVIHLNGGNFQFLNCGKLFVQTFNVNADYKVTGTGYIKVEEVLQLHGFLTSSPSIKICQTTYPGGSAAFGNAVRACDNTDCPIIEY